ncbi:MAG TPA: phenylalanine--tRNA ligase subunit alpha [Candidatus Sulfotelmatobacter sp.]|nr:phenylalanine--tRNA ligase subunit alpha [Candidatus Sulfotelmatobacter sp.]
MRTAPASGGTEDVHAVAGAALDEISAATQLKQLTALRSRFLGRGDGQLTAFRNQIGRIPDAQARRQFGQTVNELVQRVEEALDERRGELEAEESRKRLASEALDLTRPAPLLRRGHLHPVTRAAREIRRIFGFLGYTVVGGPEVEYDRYNFTLVNMPPGHPSRDTQETFFIDDDRLLRTQTSPVQIRAMVSLGAPLRVIVPGKVYRRDYDATHFPMFHQVEGLYVDEGVSMGDLKGTLEFFARSMFGPDRAIRLRPHHFAFTEPSIEVDVSCMVCGGDGCRICKWSGWLEILGAGMVHPRVLRNGGVDPERFTGFAFGVGIERIAQLAYGVEDGRLFYENDLRFIRQA